MRKHECRICNEDFLCSHGSFCRKNRITCADCRKRMTKGILLVIGIVLAVVAVCSIPRLLGGEMRAIFWVAMVLFITFALYSVNPLAELGGDDSDW